MSEATPRRALLALVLLGLALRVGLLAWLAAWPGFAWEDPDYYLDAAARLNPPGFGWNWSIDVFRWFELLRAPLYVVFLGLFQPLGDSAAAAAALASIALDALTLVGVFLLGQALHSSRAGLCAAALAAVWFPALAQVSWVRQERVYVPLLLLGLGLSARALRRDAGPRGFALAGAAVGLAALARSMPVYFAIPAALAILGLPVTRAGLKRAGAWLLAFASVTLPWSVAASSALSHPVLVEEIGAHGFARSYPDAYAEVVGLGPPAGGATALRVLALSARRDPLGFGAELIARAAAGIRVDGGRWLLAHGHTTSRAGAAWLEGLVRGFGDLPFALVALAAPWGWALARGRRAANLAGLFVLVHVGLTALAGYAGARFRAPIEPILIALAAGALAGWREAPLGRRALAALLGVGVAVPVLGSAPASLALHARYGTGPWLPAGTARVTNLWGDAGFHVQAVASGVELRFWRGLDAQGALALRVLVDGKVVDTLQLPEGDPGDRRLLAPRRSGEYSWVEVQCLRCEGGRRLAGVAVTNSEPP